ncbi:MAG: hypothetical protein WCI45_08800, partial [Desulfuromonadales bacterium]
DRVRARIGHLDESQHGRITLSIGLVTFNGATTSAQEALKIADDLMYDIKRGGKNGIKELERA